jgi:hypothetical protein
MITSINEFKKYLKNESAVNHDPSECFRITKDYKIEYVTVDNELAADAFEHGATNYNQNFDRYL